MPKERTDGSGSVSEVASEVEEQDCYRIITTLLSQKRAAEAETRLEGKKDEDVGVVAGDEGHSTWWWPSIMRNS